MAALPDPDFVERFERFPAGLRLAFRMLAAAQPGPDGNQAHIFLGILEADALAHRLGGEALADEAEWCLDYLSDPAVRDWVLEVTPDDPELRALNGLDTEVIEVTYDLTEQGWIPR